MTEPPLKALVAHPGKTLFGRPVDAGISTYPSDWTGDVEPDLIVVPCSRPSDLDASAIRMPENVAQRLRDGRALLVLDSSLEGLPHTDAWIRDLLEVADPLCVDRRRVVYITQDRGWRSDHIAWCAQHRQAPVAVIEYDHFIVRFFGNLARDGEAIYERRLERFRSRPAHRSRRFLSLNWTVRPHKALFLLRLMRDGLWDKGWISFGGFEMLQRTKSRGLYQFAKRLRRASAFADLVAELEPGLKKLDAQGQISLGPAETGEGDPNFAWDAGLPAYDDSWFSVVTETEMQDRFVRVTEKPFKSLVNFHPTILLANPGALAFVRGLGFQSFRELFDESYDDEPDPRRRFELVYQQVQKLCAAPEAQLKAAEAALAEVLDFNARWGLMHMPGIWRERADRALAQDLLAIVRQTRPD